MSRPRTTDRRNGWSNEGSAPEDAEARAAIDVPSVDDGTIFTVLDKLLYLGGQRLSYKALDVEQIGSVYEALMGFDVERLVAPAVRIKLGSKKGAARVWVTGEELVAIPKASRVSHLQEALGFDKATAAKVAEAVASAKKGSEAIAALEPLAGKRGARGSDTAEAGTLVLQPGPERRRTSSHYTPRELTEPIVARTLEPLLRVMGDAPSSETLLNLVICDPAMPSYRPATAVRYRALLRQSVLEFFGDMRLDQIETSAIRAFAAKLQQRGVQTKGPVTLVRTVLRAAVESGHLVELPRFPRGLAKTSRKLPDAPSERDYEQMLSAAAGWLGMAMMLSGMAGMRMGEVLALEVRDVDFDGHRILLRRALTEGVSLTPKSGHDRVVPLVPELEARLRDAVRCKLPKARIVVDEKGETPRRQHVLAQFKRVLRKAGLKERSFHSLRHFFITELVRKGAGLEAVRMLAGHSKLEMTQRYAHATGDDLKVAIGKLRT